MNITLELTDTFGGEANYSWVKRKEIHISDKASDLSIVRQAKKAFDMQGIKCIKETYGDSIVLKPQGYNVVLFITFP